jgi:hypothetical protein
MTKRLQVMSGVAVVALVSMVGLTSPANAVTAPPVVADPSSIAVVGDIAHPVGTRAAVTEVEVPITYTCPVGVIPQVDGTISQGGATVLAVNGVGLSQPLPYLPVCTGLAQTYNVYMAADPGAAAVGPADIEVQLLTGLSDPDRAGEGALLATSPAVADGAVDAVQGSAATAPAAVTGIAATAALQSVELTWTPPVTPVGDDPIAVWKISCSTTSGVPLPASCANGMVVPVDETAATATATFAGLATGTTYSFNVRGETDGLDGPASDVIATTTVAPILTIPGTVATATAVPAGDTVTLSWTPPTDTGGDPITGYQVTRDGTDLSNAILAPMLVPAATQTEVFANLRAATPYTFTVAAINAIGTGTVTYVAATTAPATAPGAVTAPTASSTATTITLKWDPPTTTGGDVITGYLVTRNGTDTNGNGAYSTVLAPTAGSVTFDLLHPSTAYRVTVTAVNAAGSGPTETDTVRTLAGPTPVAQHITMKANHASILVGQRLTFSGVVTPHHRGQVILQQFRNGHWYFAKEVREAATGRYTVSLTPAFGTYKARIVAVASAGFKTATSASVSVQIKR